MQKINQILITGLPGCGKTTLIREIASKIEEPYYGFFTSEIRQNNTRVGFEIETFSGKKGLLAHVNIKSPYKVSKYGVDLEAFENIALPELEKALQSGSLLLIDEIGKMELFSQKFKELLQEALKSKIKLIATIMLKPEPFCDRLKDMPGAKVIALERNIHEEILETVSGLLANL
jgi:nucleoside-triphosphatase